MMSLPGDLHEHHWEAGCSDTSDHSHSKSNAEGDLAHFAHLQRLPRFQRKLITWRIFLLDTPPPSSLCGIFFRSRNGVFFWRLPTSQQQHLVARSYVPQCWKPSSFSCSPMNIQLGIPTGGGFLRFCRVDGSWRQFQNLSFGFSIWVLMLWFLESMASWSIHWCC